MDRIDPDVVLTAGVRKVIRALRSGGATARLVGGCVRDALLDMPVGDRDLAVDVPPDRTVELLRRAGIQVKPIGIEFGVVLALPREGSAYEVGSLRRDMRSDGRWPSVRYGADWGEDARRRDFTINAFYADESGRVFDPVGGQEDLRARRVRFIGSPEARIREDYLRILRFFRFHARYAAGAMQPEGLRACRRYAERVALLSGERVGHEMRKLLAAPDPALSLAGAESAGVLQVVLPGSVLQGTDRLVSLEREFGVAPDWRRRWLLLGADAPDLPVDAWRLSRAEARSLRLRRNAWRSGHSPLEAGYRWGAEAAVDAMLARAARSGCGISGEDLADARRAAGAKLPVSAGDFLAAGVPRGKAVGEALRRAERHWLLRRMQPGRDELMEAAVSDGGRAQRS